jgi:pimeloyl-ACP methyl ester carboxylesterase
MAVTQKAPRASTFSDPVTTAAWKVKPAWYQVSAADRVIHPDNERRMAMRIGARKTIELDASHASLASQPSAVTDLIDDAASSIAD